ncbi:MAG TPA: metalloregulator ArsR/SmtB family transcription factor [Ilumatobacteraceae bacterium]
MDDVFKALADPTRRSLLDELFRQDGQTLGELERQFPITRIGVMKHLKQLEQAGLVVTRRRGREKLHFLNPVPIRLVHDRWVTKYTETWATALIELKDRMENTMDNTADTTADGTAERTLEKVFEIYIRTTPERLWDAITDPAVRGKFQFGNSFEADWREGGHYVMTNPNSPVPLGEGDIVEIDPPRKLVQTMLALWSDDVKAEGTSRVTWEIEQVGDSCRLIVTHDQMRAGTNAQIYGGWPMILSGLKTWLETGTVLTTPGSLMYG